MKDRARAREGERGRARASERARERERAESKRARKRGQESERESVKLAGARTYARRHGLAVPESSLISLNLTVSPGPALLRVPPFQVDSAPPTPRARSRASDRLRGAIPASRHGTPKSKTKELISGAKVHSLVGCGEFKGKRPARQYTVYYERSFVRLISHGALKSAGSILVGFCVGQYQTSHSLSTVQAQAGSRIQHASTDRHIAYDLSVPRVSEIAAYAMPVPDIA
eukprot:25299-Rhodomonas_salina.1